MSGTSSSNNLVLQVLQMAKITFARKLSANPLRRELVLPPDEFKSNLRELKQLMTGLKSSDLGLEHSETIKGTSGRRSPLSGLFRRTANEAPVTYIKVLEDIDVSIGIFIVKAGSRLPLHNHPNMYGWDGQLTGWCFFSCKKLEKINFEFNVKTLPRSMGL